MSKLSQSIQRHAYERKLAEFVSQDLLPPLDYLHHKPGSVSAGIESENAPQDYNPYRDPTFLRNMEPGEVIKPMAAIGAAGTLGGAGWAARRMLKGQRWPGLAPLALLAGGVGTLAAMPK